MRIEFSPSELSAIVTALSEQSSQLGESAARWRRKGFTQMAQKLESTAIEYDAIVTGIRMQVSDAKARAAR